MTRVPTNPGPLDPTPWQNPEDRLEPEQLAWLSAYRQSALRGWPTVKAACNATGVSRGTYHRWMQDDPDFREAKAYADEEGAEMAIEEGGRRAFVGLKRHKFYHGEPIPDPEVCECGRAREEHRRLGPGEWGGCEASSCDAFHGRPYYELEFSDNLARQFLQAKAPGFERKLEVSSGTLAGIPYDQLPDEVIYRITQLKEHPLAALVAVLGERHPALIAAGMEDGDEVVDAEWEEVGSGDGTGETDEMKDDDEIEL